LYNNSDAYRASHHRAPVCFGSCSGEPVAPLFCFRHYRDMTDDSLNREIESKVEALGFETVEVERAGNQARPIIRLRIDRPDGGPESGVTLDECAEVSRALEASLDSHPGLSERYVLEVSSPGVERPLVRPRDWSRFAGQEATVTGNRPLLPDGSSRAEGTILGIVGEAGEEEVSLRLADGSEVSFPLSAVKKAQLKFDWG